MKQVVVINGGHALDIHEDFLKRLKEKPVTTDTFKNSHDWKEYLQRDLGIDFEVFNPRMPNKEKAVYAEWKTWFERLIPFLNNEVILIGHSLGGLFLIKYLSETIFSKNINALILVAAPYGGKNNKHAPNNNFYVPGDFNIVIKQAKKIFLYHSKNDPVVPFYDFEIYKEKLPTARCFVFDTEGHFNGESVPGLVELIKKAWE